MLASHALYAGEGVARQTQAGAAGVDLLPLLFPRGGGVSEAALQILHARSGAAQGFAPVGNRRVEAGQGLAQVTPPAELAAELLEPLGEAVGGGGELLGLGGLALGAPSQGGGLAVQGSDDLI